jgi:hypothetical protein
VATWYEFSRLGGLNDAELIQAASKHIHAHSIGTIQSASSAVAYGVTDDWTLALRLPYVLRTNIREGHHEYVHGGGVLNTVDARGDSRGFGDAVLLAQGRFLNNVMTGTQAAFLIGVKAPSHQQARCARAAIRSRIPARLGIVGRSVRVGHDPTLWRLVA